MDRAAERRGAGGTRIPLESQVELSHEGFSERFEADAVNVSAGGLAMRASYLPDVGARLRCRFPGRQGALVEAGAEVVWSSDRGGEFGLRFLELDDQAARAIRSLVSSRGYKPPAPGGPRSAEDTLDDPLGPVPVSLAIDGVSSPIRVGVVTEDDDVLTVCQELPFLRLKTGVTIHKDGRRGRIEGIDLRVDGETPRLLIDIVFDDVAPLMSIDPSIEEPTLSDFERPAPPISGDTQVELAAPETARAPDDDELEAAIAEAVAAEEPRQAGREPRIVRIPSSRPRAPGAREALSDGDTPGSIDEALSAMVAAREPTVVEVSPQPVEDGATPTPTQSSVKDGATSTQSERARQAIDALVRRLAPLRARAMSLASQLRPLLIVLFGKMKERWATFRTERAPTISAHIEKLGRRVAATMHLLRDRIGEKVPTLAPKSRRRRKTAPPPGGSNIARRAREKSGREAERPEKRRRRTLLLSAVAFVGVSLGVWALTPHDETVDAADPLAGRTPVVAEVAEPAPAAPQPETALSSPAAEAPLAATPAPATPVMPRAVGEAPRRAGPMPAPTFPSLRDGARPEAPATLPEGSPYAVDVREGGAAPASATEAPVEGAVFGAPDVADGRSFLIRMSQPVSFVRGTARADGFTVTVPNSLSLDRAGPIAASHPLVARSMILNRGDHCELTITFVEGRTPAYRVSARGSAIEVVIARR
jgi:hypothetical protein